MNLMTKLKKKPTGQLGVADPATGRLFGDLKPLADLIQPVRKGMAEYDKAIHALATARERLRDLGDAPPPAMTLTVQREVLASLDDTEALARFDAEHGIALKAEIQEREDALRDRTELPARIQALEELVRGIAQRMMDDVHVTKIETVAQQLFEPYAQRLAEAAAHYVEVLQATQSAAHALEQVTRIAEYDLFASRKSVHQPELLADFQEGILPGFLAGVESEEIRSINRRVREIDGSLATRMGEELEAHGLRSDTMRIFAPPNPDDPRGIYAPELTRRVKRPLPVVKPYAAW